MVEQEKIQKALDNINGFFNSTSPKKICRANIITSIIALNFQMDLGNNDEKIRKFSTYLEKLIGYSYNTACEKCRVSTKVKDNMGLALSGMEQLLRR